MRFLAFFGLPGVNMKRRWFRMIGGASLGLTLAMFQEEILAFVTGHTLNMALSSATCFVSIVVLAICIMFYP
jgi:hypothetical protein